MDPTLPRLHARSERLDEEERDLIHALYDSLRRYAAVVGPPEEEPDDLVQEAFLRVLRRGPLTDLSNPGAYLRRTILNLSSNERRRLGRLRRAITRLATEDREDDIYISDLGELMSLSPRTRAVLFLSAVEGYSFREVAELVGCSEAAARKIASRERRRLRRRQELEVTRNAEA